MHAKRTRLFRSLHRFLYLGSVFSLSARSTDFMIHLLSSHLKHHRILHHHRAMSIFPSILSSSLFMIIIVLLFPSSSSSSPYTVCLPFPPCPYLFYHHIIVIGFLNINCSSGSRSSSTNHIVNIAYRMIIKSKKRMILRTAIPPLDVCVLYEVIDQVSSTYFTSFVLHILFPPWCINAKGKRTHNT